MRRLIKASAGSGKTYRLSGHFLRQLFLGHEPETILATTFTRKAAGEILSRVLLRLADAASDPAAAQRLAAFLTIPDVTQDTATALLAKVTAQLHRLRVSTLDSFFQQIARSLTLELGLPPGWSIVDDYLSDELKSQAIDIVLAQQIHGDAVELMLMLARGRHKRSVRTLIDETVANFHTLFLKTTPDAWDQIPAGHRPAAVELISAVTSLTELAEQPGPWQKVIVSDLERHHAQTWPEFLEKGVAGKVLLGEPKYNRKDIPPELIALYTPLVAQARAEVLDRIRAQLKGIRNLLTRFDREFSKLLAEHGWLRFDDVTRVLANSTATSDGARMSFRLDSSIRNLLLDEFQDTSPDQWQILDRLRQFLDAHPDSSFFCVGDGKQAIYGWRGGEAEILDAVQETVPGISTEPLDESRRSSPVVIETVNRIFSRIEQHSNLSRCQEGVAEFVARFPEHSTAQRELRGYVCLRTGPDVNSGGMTIDEDSDPEDATDRADVDPGFGQDWFKWVAAQVRELHRQCPAAEIGVLTRRKNSVAQLVHELTQLGVPASEEGGTPPTDSAAVLAVMSLLQFAAYPACGISRFHVAESPLGPIVGLDNWRDDQLASRVTEQVRARLIDDGYGRTLQAWSDAIQPHCNERDRVRLQQVVAEAWKFDADGSLNPRDFVQLLAQAQFQRSRPTPVRVMTIHQSKGLEFHTVVLPELDQKLVQTPRFAFGSPAPGTAPDRVCTWQSKKIVPLLPQRMQDIFDDTLRRQTIESLCVFYVALTRAKHSLHLLMPPVTAKKLPATYAGLLVAALADGSQTPPLTKLFEVGDPNWFESVPELKRASEHQPTNDAVPQVRLAAMPDGRRRGLHRRTPSQHAHTRLFLPAAVSISTLTSGRRSSKLKPKPVVSSVDPRTRGILIHAWFECIEWLDETTNAPDESLLRASAAKLTISDDIMAELLPDFFAALLVPAIRSVFDQSAAGRELSRSANGELQVHRERSFLFLDGNELVQGTMDRLVLCLREGQPESAMVIDFKTDRLVGDLAEWTRSRQDHYAPQLAEYRTAVAHCFNIPAVRVTSRLVFVEAGVVVDA